MDQTWLATCFFKINLYHNKAKFPYSQIICSYFYMKKAELSNCNETTWSEKPKIIAACK